MHKKHDRCTFAQEEAKHFLRNLLLVLDVCGPFSGLDTGSKHKQETVISSFLNNVSTIAYSYVQIIVLKSKNMRGCVYSTSLVLYQQTGFTKLLRSKTQTSSESFQMKIRPQAQHFI